MSPCCMRCLSLWCTLPAMRSVRAANGMCGVTVCARPDDGTPSRGAKYGSLDCRRPEQGETSRNHPLLTPPGPESGRNQTCGTLMDQLGAPVIRKECEDATTYCHPIAGRRGRELRWWMRSFEPDSASGRHRGAHRAESGEPGLPRHER